MATVPSVWPDAAAYDATVRGLIARGAALDDRSIYVLARLSPRYPTVEVRVADVCLDVGTAVLVAGLTRALVATALAEARQGTPVPAAPAPRPPGSPRPWTLRHGTGSPGPASTRSPGELPMRGHSAPACSITSAPPQRPRRHPDHHHAAATAR